MILEPKSQKGSQNDVKLEAKIIIFDKKSMKKSMRKSMPKKSWKLMKNQCENGSEFERTKCIFWYVSKLNSSFLKALNVLKPLVLLGRTHFAEKEEN